MIDRLAHHLRSPALSALVLQGLSGLIQLSAFITLKGMDYLQFCEAFLVGSVLSLLLVLNLENEILGGAFSVAMRRYFLLFWIAGIMAVLHAVLGQASTPSFVAFACWGVCTRLFLAWSSNRRPGLAGPLLGGVAGLAALMAGVPLTMVMLVAMAAFPLAAWRSQGPSAAPQAAFGAVIWSSARSYVRYLPHTLSGLLVGYVDRFLALKIIGGPEAESY
jgi:hypothetical protein